MLTARADQRVLGYLGRALSLELSAVQLYSTQARLVASWGLTEAAARLRNESEEELEHANRIIERMLATGVAPSASQLRPVRLARDLSSLLQINQQFESELIELYSSAVNHCARIGDHDHRAFFEGLLEDERFHHQELLSWQVSLQPARTSAR
ncbi:MAG: bacterioferritin [Gammaproteobacteria bacterium]|nr:bacterioferritin [Gammaproteobacteria bacterium]MCB1923952.1 bacterioferritin [Gammaproteobacteria bacterium]